MIDRIGRIMNQFPGICIIAITLTLCVIAHYLGTVREMIYEYLVDEYFELCVELFGGLWVLEHL